MAASADEMNPIVMVADTPVLDQPVSCEMGTSRTGSENMAPIATQPNRPPAATITQRYETLLTPSLLLNSNDRGRIWPRSRELPRSGPETRQRLWLRDAPDPNSNRAPPRSWFTYKAFSADERMFGWAARRTAPYAARPARAVDGTTHCATMAAFADARVPRGHASLSESSRVRPRHLEWRLGEHLAGLEQRLQVR